MANPQVENGHTKIANELLEALARINLSAYEWRVLLCVIRKTYGWRKKMDSMSLRQLVEMTGLRKPHVCRTKKSLLKKNILTENKGRLGVNKNYDLWQGVTDSGNENVTDSGNENVTDSGNKSLPIQVTTKERKETLQKVSSSAFENYWNSKNALPAIRALTEHRKQKLNARMKETLFKENWRTIIDRLNQSNFCTGQNDRGWKANIDWLLKNSNNYTKVLEGRYDNKQAEELRTTPVKRNQDGKTPLEKLREREGIFYE